MSTKRGTARGSSGTYTQARGGARAERGGSLRAIDVIFMILAVAAAILLLLEFCSDFKPSNGFKREELVSEQTENNEREADRSVSASFARVSAFSDDAPPRTCNHTVIGYTFERDGTIFGQTGTYTFEYLTDSGRISKWSTYILSLYNRAGERVCRIDNDAFFVQHVAEMIDSNGKKTYMNCARICCHNFRSKIEAAGLNFNLLDLESAVLRIVSTATYCKSDINYYAEEDRFLCDAYFTSTAKTGGMLVYTSGELTMSISKPLPPDPEKEGYTFTGWYTDEECTIPYEGETVTDDVTLYAGWQINTYTLTLNGNGGELSAGSVSGEYNTVPTIPEPTRTGYTFTGWQTAAGEAYDAAGPLTQNQTLTAQWQINTYTLTLNGNGGELSAGSVSGEYNTVPTIPTPTRTGYTFTGWKTAAGETYDVTTPLTQNLTLTAQWQINTYTLTLNGNGGELSASSVSGEYNTVPTIPEPTRTGYTFTGWKTSAGKAYDVSSPFTQNLTLTAQWKIKTFTVTFMVDGEVYQTMTVDYGTKLVQVLESAEPALFALYSVDGAGESLASDYAIDEDITVHAEEGTIAQKIKGNWKRVVVVGVCGAVLVAFVIGFPAMLIRRRMK